MGKSRHLKHFVRNVFGIEAIDRWLCERYTGQRRRERYRRGHYHSPLPDLEYVAANADRIFEKDVDLGASIDLRADAQRTLFRELAGYAADYPWRDGPSEGTRFDPSQDMFLPGDGFVLYAMLRHRRPRRVIEVGSGYTSALMLDVDERFLGGTTSFTFIEPFPARLHGLLRETDPEQVTILEQPVQDVALETFDSLRSGDLLFIDSSHVSRAGSDVNHLVFEVLPRLAPGVMVQFHDILWPFEYLPQWLAEGKAWNEAYLARAFLQYNDAFRILLFSAFVDYRFQDLAEDVPFFFGTSPGSLWLERSEEKAGGVA